MIDFMIISTRPGKDKIEIYPKFIIKKSSDLMIRGGKFYAIWIEEKGLWSTDEQDAVQLIDRELDIFAKEYKEKYNAPVKVLHMWDSDTGMIDKWHRYCEKQMRDSYHTLDEKLIFANDKVCKTDYSSKRLKYPLEPGDISAYDKLMSTLYSEEERHKLDWAIGSIVCGDSKFIQKFIVLYGAFGTGKSTVLNIIQKLFDGYYSVFDAKALGSSNNSFALESFKDNPLVAIQHDGDLSRIEDNTRINSLVSHEDMTVNEKFKSTYISKFQCFLFMGTNNPVKITDAKSGLMRRLIDVSPSGNKVPRKEYNAIVKQIDFELGAIACYCRDVYLEDPDYYNDYVPIAMLGASNDFYNFMLDSYFVFSKDDATTLKASWEMYKNYCEEANVKFPLSQRPFKEELKNYFEDYKERITLEDGTRVRNYYIGFRKDKFEEEKPEEKPVHKSTHYIEFKEQESIFDEEAMDYPAQYASQYETPSKKWSDVTTTLKDIDTHELHYVKVPENHIVIDFDIKDSEGNKCFEKNLEEASKWPKTYAELSKSGGGIHLHYIYDGDVTKLSRIYDENIEIKVYNGNSSLRRKLTKCNDIPIATINSGLPVKGDSKLINFDAVKSEKALRVLIYRNLNKEIHPATKPSIDFIYKILEDAYNSGLAYDVSDLRGAIFSFASKSSNQAEYCLKLVPKMKFKSEVEPEGAEFENDTIVFYDVEVFPNLFVVCWKARGVDNTVKMINPTAQQIEELLKFKLVGFNNREYDNHILYARLMGYNNLQLYQLSKKLIGGVKCKFREAFNLSYTDIYDFAQTKQSLKKWQIELGIHHQELGLPWDEPVPEKLWNKVAEYCVNDVVSTEAVFEHLQADFTARKVLAELTGMTVNDTTNSISARFIFGKDKDHKNEFQWRDMGDTNQESDTFTITEQNDLYVNYGDEYTRFTKDFKPIFPGYKFEYGHSLYRGVDPGEGGRVTSKPGMYIYVALLDIESMHPHSIIAENLFGKYTKRFKEIVDTRLAIKHKDFEKAKKALDGAFLKYLDNDDMIDALAFALKIVINSIYGLTSAKFDNAFKDSRNVDNIVAKRGALFMINLEHEVTSRGYTVAHIKTDSIKIPNADMKIINFVKDYGKMYGYNFDHEATYEKMCLVNNAVYIAKFASTEYCEKAYGYLPSKQAKNAGQWTATGTQFQVPYVFKTLFSKEPITFEDLCEVKSVKDTALYLDFNESLPDDSEYVKQLGKISSDLRKLQKKNIDEYKESIGYVNKGTNSKQKENDVQTFIENNTGIYRLFQDTDTTLSASAKTDILGQIKSIKENIEKCHDYQFIGKTGQFTPVKPGCGGGYLVRSKKDVTDPTVDLYASAAGTKGYRWMESEAIRKAGTFDIADKSYHNHLVDEAIKEINKYGNFDEFVSDGYAPANDVPWYN